MGLERAQAESSETLSSGLEWERGLGESYCGSFGGPMEELATEVASMIKGNELDGLAMEFHLSCNETQPQ